MILKTGNIGIRALVAVMLLSFASLSFANMKQVIADLWHDAPSELQTTTEITASSHLDDSVSYDDMESCQQSSQSCNGSNVYALQSLPDYHKVLGQQDGAIPSARFYPSIGLEVPLKPPKRLS